MASMLTSSLSSLIWWEFISYNLDVNVNKSIPHILKTTEKEFKFVRISISIQTVHDWHCLLLSKLELMLKSMTNLDFFDLEKEKSEQWNYFNLWGGEEGNITLHMIIRSQIGLICDRNKFNIIRFMHKKPHFITLKLSKEAKRSTGESD